jgi:DNA-binding protein
MRTFEVLAPIQLSNKRIAKFGEKVSEKQLHDNADELLKRKFIKEVEVEEIEVVSEVVTTDNEPAQEDKPKGGKRGAKPKK